MKTINWCKATFILAIALLMTIPGVISVIKLNYLTQLDNFNLEEACKAKGAEYYNSGEYDCINSKGSPIILNPPPEQHEGSTILFVLIFIVSGIILVICIFNLFKVLLRED